MFKYFISGVLTALGLIHGETSLKRI